MGFISPSGVEVTNIGKQTYSAASTAFNPPATPTDVFTITGSATKQVRVTKIGFTSTQTTSGMNQWFLVKYSTANGGGTATAPAPVPMDSLNSAATASVFAYTVNPAGGTALGSIFSALVWSPAPAAASGLILTEVDLVDMFGQPLVLRGVAQSLALNFNGAALPVGLTVMAYVQWTEE